MDYTYFCYYITVAFSSDPLSHRSVSWPADTRHINSIIRVYRIVPTLACVTHTPAHKTRAKPGPWDHTVYLPRLIRIFRVSRLLSRRAWRVLCTALTRTGGYMTYPQYGRCSGDIIWVTHKHEWCRYMLVFSLEISNKQCTLWHSYRAFLHVNTISWFFNRLLIIHDVND